jgi:hypothetical protein
VAREEGDVTRTDFIDWCEKYMRPSKMLGCSGKDLYGARCAVLHSQTVESRMSRTGEARPIIYSHGPRAYARLCEMVRSDPPGAQRAVVDLTALLASFMEGVTAFSDDVAGDPKRTASTEQRARNWLSWNRVAKPETPEERAEIDTAHARAETWKEAAHEVQNHMERRAADPEYRDEIPKDILDLFTSELGYPRH